MVKKNQGMITIILALFTTFFVALLAIAMWDLMSTDLKIATNLTRDTQAIYIADAGIEDAIYELRQDKDWNTGFVTKEILIVSGTYTVTRDVNTLVSLGKVADFQRRVIASVLISGPSPPYTVKIMSWQEE